MQILKPYILFLSLGIVVGQDTFSIVAVDPSTGQVGSAGASCIAGSIIISDVHPGVGVIHSQSYWNSINQDSAASLMEQGYSPEAIIDWLIENDAENDPSIRQYGVADLIDEGRSAGYTGENCYDYKGHFLGQNYAIQGNILLGRVILEDMEFAFLTQYGTFEEKLMAALMAANVTGADSRCTQYGTPAISGFIRVATPEDSPDSFYMDINVDNAPLTINPLDSLNNLYWEWKKDHYRIGDINFDGNVDLIDLTILSDHIQEYQEIMEFAYGPADLNMSGSIEISDLYLLLYEIIGIIEL